MTFDQRRARLIPNGAEYQRVHRWVTRELGKADRCSLDPSHTASRYDWSNISREYKQEPSDWQQLCRSCHRLFDGISEEGRRSISEKNRINSRGNTNRRVPVVCLDDKKKISYSFNSAAEAAKHLGISRTNICNVLRGWTKTAGGYRWQYGRVYYHV